MVPRILYELSSLDGARFFAIYMEREEKEMDVKEILEKQTTLLGKEMTVKGWIRNHRKQKEFGFIAFTDGTCFETLQIVYDKSLKDFDEIQKIHIGSSISVVGTLVESPKEGQAVELVASSIILEGECPEDYPMQAKGHSREFLREQAYLRPRTNLFQAVFRIRNVAAFAIHTYFQEKGFVYVNSPLLTANDGEGAGEMFQVTTMDLANVPKTEDGEVDFQDDFFGEKVGLTVTGQLEAEAFAHAFKKVYTFGPTFRAENSNTQKHASEFWMIEPEMCFCDLEELMDVEEDMLKFIVRYVLEHAKSEMAFLDRFVENGLIEKLNRLVESKFTRITHHDVITLLKKADVKWEFSPEYGEDIATEHEKYLTEYFQGPVFVTDWPKDIKAFYMKLNADGETVAAVDLEVPGAGELMGGSQREENYEKLVARMEELGMEQKGLEWYLNLRKYGGCTHSGFGMGFERLLIYLTGVDNIRDVIPFPRTPGNCAF